MNAKVPLSLAPETGRLVVRLNEIIYTGTAPDGALSVAVAAVVAEWSLATKIVSPAANAIAVKHAASVL